MKPTEDLIQEHTAIKLMLNVMQKIAGNINSGKGCKIIDIEKIVDFLKTFADKCHHGKEETALFPALMQAGISKENGPVGVMLHEHEIGRKYINDINIVLEACKPGETCSSPLLAEAMLNYVDLLQNHILKEENVLFPMADKVLNEQQQSAIYVQFEKIEEEIVGHGIHEQYHEMLKKFKRDYLN